MGAAMRFEDTRVDIRVYYSDCGDMLNRSFAYGGHIRKWVENDHKVRYDFHIQNRRLVKVMQAIGECAR